MSTISVANVFYFNSRIVRGEKQVVRKLREVKQKIAFEIQTWYARSSV